MTEKVETAVLAEIAADTPTAMPDPVQSARDAGLRYVHDWGPGITRRRNSDGTFSYFHPNGRPVTDQSTLERIRKLALPPAYTDVWICLYPNGHLQATGRDARGRKQYRYHAKWRSVRDETKYGRMILFGRVLPEIRKRIDQDLRQSGLSREKVLAAVVRLLEQSLIRVGNDEYARSNNSYGLTTLQDEHVEITGSLIRFRFKGKHGKDHEIDIRDRRLAGIVKRCRDLPGQELFQYLDNAGVVHDIGSNDVNEYLRLITGCEFTAKDFRTWAGTVYAAWELCECGPCKNQREAKSAVVRAVEKVARRLGNTPAICRKCYIHPAVIELYMGGKLIEELKSHSPLRPPPETYALRPEETAVLTLLERQMEKAALEAA